MHTTAVLHSGAAFIMPGEVIQTSNFGFIGIIRAQKHDAETGELVSDNTYYNTDTYFMRQAVAGWIAGTQTTTTTPPPTQIGAGNGIGTPSPSDTALWSPIAGTQRACDSITITYGYYAQYNITYQTTDPAGAYTEVGLFDDAGNLWAHAAINEIKSSSQTLTIQWMVLTTNDASNTSAVLTNYACSTITSWLVGPSNGGSTTTTSPPPTQLTLGIGSGFVSPSDTALWSPVSGTTTNCSAIYISATYNVQFMGTYSSTYPQNNYTEVGLVDKNGNLWMHAALTGASNQNNLVLSILLQIAVNGN
jgi:hypothetical protein